MNRSETATLLSVVASFNNRTVGEADVIAWHSVLDDIDFGVAEQAVRRHYKGSADWIMPVHVRRLVEEIELEERRAASPWAPGQYKVPRDQTHPAVASFVAEPSPEVSDLLARLRERLSDGGRDTLFPRQEHWAREHKAYVRTRNAAPNPLYRTDRVPGCICIISGPAVEGPDRDCPVHGEDVPHKPMVDD